MKLFNGLRLFATVSRLKRPKVKLNPLPVLKTAFDTTPQDSVFGNDLQKAMNFLNRVAKVLDITIPKPEAVETTRNTAHSLYEVLAHNRIEIPEKYRFIFKKEYLDSVKELTYFGRAKSITEARQRAFFHLAECLYSSLKSADSFLPTVDQDPKKVLPFVKFNLTDSQKSELKSVIEECEELLNESVNEIVPVKPINERTKFVNEHRPETSHYKRPGPLTGKLPIYRHYREIIESVEGNQVTIVSATTGSGKTTQIPKFIMHHFGAEKPSIIVTQPRRVAAISLANRVAHELGEKGVGNSVGYSVRFDSVPPNPNQSNIRKPISSLNLIFYSCFSVLHFWFIN